MFFTQMEKRNHEFLTETSDIVSRLILMGEQDSFDKKESLEERKSALKFNTSKKNMLKFK